MTATARVLAQHDGQPAWDELVAATPGGHVLQSWAWGELKARFGWRVQRLAVDGALAQVLFRSLPGGLGTIAYVPKGPLADYSDGSSFRALLDAIRPVARKERALCLKIEPDLEDDPALTEQLQAFGFRPSPRRSSRAARSWWT